MQVTRIRTGDWLAKTIFWLLLFGFAVEHVIGNGVPGVVNAAEQEQQG